MGYKGGMIHVSHYQGCREGERAVMKDIVEPFSIIECPTIKVIGFVGYVEISAGVHSLSTIYGQYLSIEVKDRFYNNWALAKKNAFTLCYFALIGPKTLIAREPETLRGQASSMEPI